MLRLCRRNVMSRSIAAFMILLGCCFAGCSAAQRPNEAVLPKGAAQPDESHLRQLLDQHRYHDALSELPHLMESWAAYTRRTGETAEGAAGFIYHYTLDRVTSSGDA